MSEELEKKLTHQEAMALMRALFQTDEFSDDTIGNELNRHFLDAMRVAFPRLQTPFTGRFFPLPTPENDPYKRWAKERDIRPQLGGIFCTIGEALKQCTDDGAEA